MKASSYLETIKPSFNILAVDIAKVENFENTQKVSIVTTQEDRKVRMVMMVDKVSNQINLIDESLVEAEEKNVVYTEKENNDGTVTVTTNSIV